MGKYMNQLRNLQSNQRTLKYAHSSRIAGLEQKGYLYELQQQHSQMMEDYYSRQIAEILPLAITETVQEEMAKYLSNLDISLQLDGEQLGKIGETAAKKITTDILGNFGKGR